MEIQKLKPENAQELWEWTIMMRASEFGKWAERFKALNPGTEFEPVETVRITDGKKDVDFTVHLNLNPANWEESERLSLIAYNEIKKSRAVLRCIWEYHGAEDGKLVPELQPSGHSILDVIDKKVLTALSDFHKTT